jgi:2-oxo-4-hydroxy-4-carboxy-5-ureidoimidazoline decarboxylase
MSVALHLNALSEEDCMAALMRCCGSALWARKMCASRPFTDAESVFKQADELWSQMTKADILEAFLHHPQIGANVESLRKKFQQTAAWSESEQASVSHASEDTLSRLAKGNAEYKARYGYIFIVCATGKSAAEMLALLTARKDNAPEIELKLAAAEQSKITKLRLEKLA